MDKHDIKEKARYAFVREKANQVREKPRHSSPVPGPFSVIDTVQRIERFGYEPEEETSAVDGIENKAMTAASHTERAISYAKRKQRADVADRKTKEQEQTSYDPEYNTSDQAGNTFHGETQYYNGSGTQTGEKMLIADPDFAEPHREAPNHREFMREQAVKEYREQRRQRRYETQAQEEYIPTYKEKADRPYIKTRETVREKSTAQRRATHYSHPQQSRQAAQEQGRRLAQFSAGKQAVRRQNHRVSRAERFKLAVERAARSSKDSLILLGALLLLIPLLLLFGAAGALFGGSVDLEKAPVSDEVKSYAGLIQVYAIEHGIPEYTELIMAVMMQESGGRGNDPMQASESGFNTKYPNTPGGISDPEYSVNVGVQALADCLKLAGAESPEDMERVSLALQGYNFGSGYIGWAIANYGGYSEINALEFSYMMAQKMGWTSYGDPQYVQHVLRYYYPATQEGAP